MNLNFICLNFIILHIYVYKDLMIVDYYFMEDPNLYPIISPYMWKSFYNCS